MKRLPRVDIQELLKPYTQERWALRKGISAVVWGVFYFALFLACLWSPYFALMQGGPIAGILVSIGARIVWYVAAWYETGDSMLWPVGGSLPDAFIMVYTQISTNLSLLVLYAVPPWEASIMHIGLIVLVVGWVVSAVLFAWEAVSDEHRFLPMFLMYLMVILIINPEAVVGGFIEIATRRSRAKEGKL